MDGESLAESGNLHGRVESLAHSVRLRMFGLQPAFGLLGVGQIDQIVAQIEYFVVRHHRAALEQFIRSWIEVGPRWMVSELALDSRQALRLVLEALRLAGCQIERRDQPLWRILMLGA